LIAFRPEQDKANNREYNEEYIFDKIDFVADICCEFMFCCAS
jgi:hypothetical protein